MFRFFVALGALTLCASYASPAAARTLPASSRFVSQARFAAGGVASSMQPGADLAMWSQPVPKSLLPAGHARYDQRIRRDGLSTFARGIVRRTSTIALTLTRSAMRYIGTPYVFGGTSPGGFDCSGYTQHVFASLGISLPRTADAQFYDGNRAKGGVRVGDLVFFQTYEPGPSHVGIYLGHGRFIHSSSHGVMVSALGDSYWANRYLGARRYGKF